MQNEDRNLQTIEGTIEDIVYRNEDSGFTVFYLSCGDELTAAVGVTADIAVGEEVTLTGNFVTHPSFGVQFKAEIIERRLPSGSAAILKYLSSGVIKGVREATARLIVERFGDDTLRVIEEEPELLAGIKGISERKTKEISEQFHRIFGIRTLMAFLAQFGVSTAAVVKIWKAWGSEAINAITRDPYLLCIQDIGISFYEADEIAYGMGFDAWSPVRLKAGTEYVLRHNLQNGHSCLPADKLIAAAGSLLDCREDTLYETLNGMCDAYELNERTDLSGTRMIYLPEMYIAERFISDKIYDMLSMPPDHTGDYLERIKELEESKGITYAYNQRVAIERAMKERISVLTGGPGTGKTTALNAVIQLCEQKGEKVLLAAPTGRAAKRMSDVTGREAKTIHRLLEVDYRDGERCTFKRCEKNPLQCDLLIVDELSMVDLLLFESLLRAVRNNTRLMLVGDPDQLASVGAGNVLSDIISSGSVIVTHLSEIFRQAAQSLIVTNSHRIVSGEMPELYVRDNDFFYMKELSQQRILNTVAELCSRRLPASFGYSPFWDIQVITPSRKGRVGTQILNKILQEQLNPPSPDKNEMTRQGLTFREGDKVMQIKNNYDITWRRDDGQTGMGVYNGDIGIIELINKPSRTVIVRFENRIVEYDADMTGELELAYALTVHKSQGSEFEAVIIPLLERNSRLNYRNLLYTATTRAKKLLIVIGDSCVISEMVANNKRMLRYSGLCDMLMMQNEGCY